MKLLLDENLSRRLVSFLQQDYPGSTQVALIGLERADDKDIWEFAKKNGFVIVTRDADSALIQGAVLLTNDQSFSSVDGLVFESLQLSE